MSDFLFFFPKVIYFTLNNDPTLTSSVYIGASVDLDPNTIFVGQLQFTKGLPLPIATIVPSLYGYQNTSSSNTSVTGLAFGATNYVIKIPPGSLFGYNFKTCKADFLNIIFWVKIIF